MDELSVIATKLDNLQQTLDEMRNKMESHEDKNNKTHAEFYSRIGLLEVDFGKLQVWTSGAIFTCGIIVGALIQKFI